MVKKEKTTVRVGDGRRAQQQAINFNYCGCYHSIAIVGIGNMLCPSSTLLDLFSFERLARLLAYTQKKFAIRFLGVEGWWLIEKLLGN